MRMCGITVHLFAAEIREDSFGVARVFLDQAVHLRNWRGHAVLIGVVECESHPKDNAALEALVLVLLQFRRIFVPACVEQISRNPIHLAPAQPVRTRYLSLAHVHHRSEEHTSELQSRQYLVCRLLLEKITK